MSTYQRSSSECSVKSEYAVPSQGAGTVYDYDKYVLFMRECTDTGSTRASCRCLVIAEAKEYVTVFSESSDTNIHQCAVQRAKQ
jgi:hypothetical protein